MTKNLKKIVARLWTLHLGKLFVFIFFFWPVKGHSQCTYFSKNVTWSMFLYFISKDWCWKGKKWNLLDNICTKKSFGVIDKIKNWKAVGSVIFTILFCIIWTFWTPENGEDKSRYGWAKYYYLDFRNFALRVVWKPAPQLWLGC